MKRMNTMQEMNLLKNEVDTRKVFLNSKRKELAKLLEINNSPKGLTVLQAARVAELAASIKEDKKFIEVANAKRGRFLTPAFIAG